MTFVRESFTASEAKREIQALRQAGDKIRRTPESAKAFLLKHKFITEQGELSKRYRG
jgi:hypothetical protein